MRRQDAAAAEAPTPQNPLRQLALAVVLGRGTFRRLAGAGLAALAAAGLGALLL